MSEQVVSKWSGFYKFCLFAAGVALPAVSIGVEVTTEMCAAEFFDPVPTVWHVLLVAFVPIANLQVWLACRKGETRRAGALGFINAVSIGIALFYTIVFASLLPLAVIALLFMGMGLLPMAPLASLIAGLLLRRELRKIAPETGEQPRNKWTRAGGLAAGVALALLTVCVVELPATVTRVGLKWAASGQVEQRERGLNLLRAWGSRDHLLRACYERRGQATDAIGFLFSMNDPVSPEEARKVYFRMTGDIYDAVAAPRLAGRWSPMRELDFDATQGGETVGGRLKDLALQESRLDGSVDGDARLAYVEWTLVFKNDGIVQREARAQVQLPPGAVVSRLTLWVNGEEREAAFAGRNRVRADYEAIVRQRRDPVLVTTSGEDRVLVQCFPVMGQGGTMKIRLGITTPLVPEDLRSSTLLMPYFVERNFNISEEFKHSIWLESKRDLETSNANFQAEHPAEKLFALRGALSDGELAEPNAAVRAKAASEAARAFTRLAGDKGDDKTDGNKTETNKASGDFIRQSLTEKEAATFRHVVLVVDGSRHTQPHLEKIANAVRNLPEHIGLTTLIARDGEPEELRADTREAMSAQLRRIACTGGTDNTTALERAWTLAAAQPGGVIVWVHEQQPVLLKPVDELRRGWDRRAGVAPLVMVATANVPNRIAEELDGVAEVKAHLRRGDLQTDIEGAFQELSGNRKPLHLVRERIKSDDFTMRADDKETSSHLARLWAKDTVERLLHTAGDDAAREKATDEATALAVRYQLVTAVSGAVVLETKEQYEQAGLRPVAAGTVPTIPEPETVLLMIVVALFLVWTLRRMRLTRRAA